MDSQRDHRHHLHGFGLIGAFLPRGITLRLEGDVNDYLGKGLSGGRLIVRPDREAPFAAEQHIIAGNVIAYGATAGEIFVRARSANAAAFATRCHGC